MQSNVHHWVDLPGESSMTDVTYQWCSKCGTLKVMSSAGGTNLMHPGGASCPVVVAEKPTGTASMAMFDQPGA